MPLWRCAYDPKRAEFYQRAVWASTSYRKTKNCETSGRLAAKNITTHCLKHKEAEDLENRIAAIEEKLKAQNRRPASVAFFFADSQRHVLAYNTHSSITKYDLRSTIYESNRPASAQPTDKTYTNAAQHKSARGRDWLVLKTACEIIGCKRYG